MIVPGQVEVLRTWGVVSGGDTKVVSILRSFTIPERKIGILIEAIRGICSENGDGIIGIFKRFQIPVGIIFRIYRKSKWISRFSYISINIIRIER